MEEEITPAVVACGSEYTASITRRGQLLTWGLGSRGELGHELPHAGEVCHAAPGQHWDADDICVFGQIMFRFSASTGL